jgi:hypothetical protein
MKILALETGGMRSSITFDRQHLADGGTKRTFIIK